MSPFLTVPVKLGSLFAGVSEFRSLTGVYGDVCTLLLYNSFFPDTDGSPRASRVHFGCAGYFNRSGIFCELFRYFLQINSELCSIRGWLRAQNVAVAPFLLGLCSKEHPCRAPGCRPGFRPGQTFVSRQRPISQRRAGWCLWELHSRSSVLWFPSATCSSPFGRYPVRPGFPARVWRATARPAADALLSSFFYWFPNGACCQAFRSL